MPPASELALLHIVKFLEKMSPSIVARVLSYAHIDSPTNSKRLCLAKDVNESECVESLAGLTHLYTYLASYTSTHFRIRSPEDHDAHLHIVRAPKV